MTAFWFSVFVYFFCFLAVMLSAIFAGSENNWLALDSLFAAERTLPKNLKTAACPAIVLATVHFVVTVMCVYFPSKCILFLYNLVKHFLDTNIPWFRSFTMAYFGNSIEVKLYACWKYWMLVKQTIFRLRIMNCMNKLAKEVLPPFIVPFAKQTESQLRSKWYVQWYSIISNSWNYLEILD